MWQTVPYVIAGWWMFFPQSDGKLIGVDPSQYFMYRDMAVCQNLVPLVNIKIAGKWMFIPLEKVLIGIDPYPFVNVSLLESTNPPMTPRFTRQLLVECIFFCVWQNQQPLDSKCQRDVSTERNIWIMNYQYIISQSYMGYAHLYTHIYIYAKRLGFAQALQRRGFPFPNKCWCNFFTKFLWEQQQRY